MDKKVLNALYNLGYLTSPVNEEKYKTIDDLIAAGYITIPGAKEKINALLSSMNSSMNKCNNTTIETEETEIVVQDTTEVEVENVVTDIVENSVEVETPSESLVETGTETTVTDEEIKEVEPKKRKSTKKVE